MTLDIPVIETERLVLRAPREEDFDAYADYAASARTEYVGGPFDRAAAWQHFLAVLGHWALRDYGCWIIELRESGAPVGLVGLTRDDHAAEPDLNWALFENCEGQGYAQEAATAARAHAASAWGFDRLASYIHPENGRAIALALRMGAVQEDETEDMDTPRLVYRHPEPSEAPDAA